MFDFRLPDGGNGLAPVNEALLVHTPGDDPDLAWWQEVVDALSSELVKVQLYEAANDESVTSAAKLGALNEAGDLVKYVELGTLLTKLMEEKGVDYEILDGRKG